MQITAVKRIDDVDVPHPPLQAVKIADLLHADRSKDVTVFGIVFQVSKPQTNHCRDGMARTTQNVFIVDDSNKTVELTLWGEHMLKLDESEGSAVVLENVVPREFRGKRTISTSSATVIKTMGDNPTGEQLLLQKWWDEAGHEQDFGNLDLEDNQAN